MEDITIRSANQNTEPGKETRSKEERKNHAEAVAFAESHRDFFEHYARGQVTIAPAPEGLETFAFDLESNTIYLNSRFYKTLGLSDEKTTFATLHEIEHFLEKKATLGEDGGAEIFEEYLGKIKESRAWSLMDNCLADIRENRAIALKTNQGLRDIEEQMYRQDLFPELDLSGEPMHTQLPQALLRESRVPDEVCIVAPAVREKIDQIKTIANKNGVKLLDVMTDPETPMSLRLKLQDLFIWPAVLELLKKDVEKEKEKKESDQKKSGENKGEETEKQEGKDEKTNGTDGKESQKEMKPDELFKEAYNRAAKRVANAVPIEEIEKAFEVWQKKQEKNPLDWALKEYAEKLGVKKEDLQKYRKIIEELNKIKNPETNEIIIEELRQLIERIIARRLKPRQAPRYPVEEGDDLVDPAQLYASAKAGNFEPKVWETQEVKQERGQRFGEVEITLICDRSSSMTEGNKLIEQRKATVFLMEALKEFTERTDEEIHNIDKPLEVRSEIRSFQSSSEDSVPLKRMSKELSEKDRIDVVAKISSAPGSTTDFVPLEKIKEGIDEEAERKIKEGQLKKIVIVFTDGGSDDKKRVSKVLTDLRSKGVEVIGIGISQEGEPALTTYAPNVRLAERAEQLSSILADVLKDNLADV